MEAPLPVSGRMSGEDIKKIIAHLDEIQYGSITLVIHDGKVVLIEKLEKIKIS
jgi:hypothetical protein